MKQLLLVTLCLISFNVFANSYDNDDYLDRFQERNLRQQEVLAEVNAGMHLND